MSKELKEQFFEENLQTWDFSYADYTEWLESKLKAVEDSLMSDEEINEIIRHYAYDAGIKLQRERTKKAIG